MTDVTVSSDSSATLIYPSLPRQIINLILYMFRALCGAYGISVSGLIILRLILGADNWQAIALFNALLLLLMLPAVALLPIFLLWRKWDVSILLITPVVMFSVVFAPRFFNTAPTLPEDAQTFTIVTYNLRSERQNTATLIDSIIEADADFVALQEVSFAMAEQIESDLSDEYPYQSLLPLENPILGIALLSRYPIIEAESWQAINYHQRILIEIDDQQIVLYNVHIAYPLFNRFDERRDDVASVIDHATAETLPVIIAGDFNLTDLSAEYLDLTAHYTDSYVEAGRGFGFSFTPTLFFTSRQQLLQFLPQMPLLRIDYVFHDEAFTAISADVLSHDGVSDHRRLLVTLGFTP